MADIGDDSVSEDQWLYGDSNPDQTSINTESGCDNVAQSMGDPFVNPNALINGESEPEVRFSN